MISTQPGDTRMDDNGIGQVPLESRARDLARYINSKIEDEGPLVVHQRTLMNSLNVLNCTCIGIPTLPIIANSNTSHNKWFLK